MCHNSESTPPIAATAGADVSHRNVALRARDGNDFAAFLALPRELSAAGVLILPDVRGLYRFYEELALRFAENGIVALAIDYFGRTAGLARRGDDFPGRDHVREMSVETANADISAAVEFLRSPGGGSCASVFTVGFCLGGRISWLAAAHGHGLAGAIGFYGGPGSTHPLFSSPGPTELAGAFECPILALQAGADVSITPELNQAFEIALARAGVDHKLVVYEGAPHGFFDRLHEGHADASADAWRRTLEFIARLVASREP